MLGCQDFCGYYEWTFHYLRRNFGRSALEKYWAQAVAADAQQHYIRAGKDNGLRGLYESWFKTGVDEKCDWTVTLDEDHNLLRLDMRECPSKGFLLKNSLNADEDYCDHCIGWIGPALNTIGAEVAAHEHNHCGQCWWEIRMKDKEYLPLEVLADIRNDPRWQRGYLDRFSHQVKSSASSSDYEIDLCDVILNWFQPFDRLMAIGDELVSAEDLPANDPLTAIVVSGRRYATGDLPDELVRGVLLEHDPEGLQNVARRFHSVTVEQRPMLMHTYLPGLPVLDFGSVHLPRAIPILPLLIRAGLYVHQERQNPPPILAFAELVAAAMRKKFIILGYDVHEQS
jgi:hypothetical protein